jgi:hypothetical protein
VPATMPRARAAPRRSSWPNSVMSCARRSTP